MDPQNLFDGAPVLFCEVLVGLGPLWTVFDVANALIGKIEESDVCRHGVSFRCGAAKGNGAFASAGPGRAALGAISALNRGNTLLRASLRQEGEEMSPLFAFAEAGH